MGLHFRVWAGFKLDLVDPLTTLARTKAKKIIELKKVIEPETDVFHFDKKIANVVQMTEKIKKNKENLQKQKKTSIAGNFCKI